MNKKLFFILLFILSWKLFSAQENLEIIITKAAEYTISFPDSTILFLSPFEKNIKKGKFPDKITEKFYHIMGDAYYYKNNLKKSIKYYSKELEISKKHMSPDQLIRIYFNLGTMAYKQKNYRKSVEYYSKSLKLAKTLNNTHILMQIYRGLSKNYEKLNYYNKAYENYKLYIKYKNEFYKIKSSDKLSLLEEKVNRIQYEKKQKEIELIQKQTELHIQKKELHQTSKILQETQEINQDLKEKTVLQNERIKRLKLQQQLKAQEVKLQKEEAKRKAEKIKTQKKIITLVSILVIIFIFFSIFVIYLLRKNKKANIELQHQNSKILQQKEKIESQRDKIIQSHNTIEKQNKKIKDSINYAKRIQEGLLPWPNTIKKFFPNHFVFFKPRDIVSGDFYWMSPRENYVYFAAADCTGHGVPGAFMSMLGIAFLTDIVGRSSELLSTNEILENLRDYIKLALQDKDDGMDMALLRFNLKTKKVQFSGANNPLIIIREKKILEFKPTHAPVGRYIKDISFKLETIQLKKGDVVYIFSDGYIDQFGGKKGNKFMKKQFKNLLLSIHEQEMEKQKELLDNTLTSWMNQPDKQFPQIDDILIVGIKI